MPEIFFRNDLISSPLLYFFDIGYVSIHLSVPDEGVIQFYFKDSSFIAWY